MTTLEKHIRKKLKQSSKKVPKGYAYINIKKFAKEVAEEIRGNARDFV